MLVDAAPTTFAGIFLCSGHTDLRKNIDGLANTLLYTYHVNPYLAENVLFLFCGRARYKIKGLVWEKNGFVMINKRLKEGRFHWNNDADAGLQEITYEQYIHLMNEGTLE